MRFEGWRGLPLLMQPKELPPPSPPVLSANLDREFRLMEQSYGSDHLDLVVAVGYLLRLIENARVVRYLAQNFSELLAEFQKIAESQKAAA